ncbi:hypothetical protein FQA47_020294 [Oryzias melastigma]|uniref:Secreted protein n=1 Tax=Oryzias melastigma TaxID=30732 RepID=A0A834KZ78_ORYME|nr:hypothetical protein FQA47_020294 [Oryzias melastigma]
MRAVSRSAWICLTLARAGGAPSLTQPPLPPAGGASPRVFLIGLTGRQTRRSAVWRSKDRNYAKRKTIKRGNQMSSDCAFREEEREVLGAHRAAAQTRYPDLLLQTEQPRWSRVKAADPAPDEDRQASSPTVVCA